MLVTYTHAGGRGELRYQYLLFIRTSRYVKAPYLNTDGAAFESFTTRQQLIHFFQSPILAQVPVGNASNKRRRAADHIQRAIVGKRIYLSTSITCASKSLTPACSFLGKSCQKCLDANPQKALTQTQLKRQHNWGLFWEKEKFPVKEKMVSLCPRHRRLKETEAELKLSGPIGSEE